MGDHLFLSFWLAGFSPLAMSVYARKLLARFPHSKLEPRSTLRVYALSFQEAPQLEEFIDGELDPKAAVEAAQHFLQEDCAVQLETRWDLWQWEDEWQLRPSRAWLEVCGPEFDSPRGEHIRIDCGPESLFLPHPSSDQLRPVQSNLRSLLHLAHDLENDLMVERRLLWSEEDDNFAARVETMLA